MDSSELAFKIAAGHAFRQGCQSAKPGILEPVMTVEAAAPHEFQGTLVALLNKRKGQMQVRNWMLLCSPGYPTSVPSSVNVYVHVCLLSLCLCMNVYA